MVVEYVALTGALPMILIVLLVLALFVLQTLLPNQLREPAPTGAPDSLGVLLGPRDSPRPFTVIGGRAARALANMQEALPVFLALALMNMIVGSAAAMVITGGWVFLIARVVYLPLYLAGIPALRTLAWGASWVGLVMMLIPLVERI
jgi:uncharacterized MAPEG superfamily protein